MGEGETHFCCHLESVGRGELRCSYVHGVGGQAAGQRGLTGARLLWVLRALQTSSGPAGEGSRAGWVCGGRAGARPGQGEWTGQPAAPRPCFGFAWRTLLRFTLFSLLQKLPSSPLSSVDGVHWSFSHAHKM